jgi:hypothetical protein
VHIQKQLFGSIGMNIVKIARPFRYEEVTIANRLNAISAMFKGAVL